MEERSKPRTIGVAQWLKDVLAWRTESRPDARRPCFDARSRLRDDVGGGRFGRHRLGAGERGAERDSPRRIDD